MASEIVSIIVPVYNSERYIDRCLNSLVNQTYPNIEIIIINDGSTDNSLDIIMDYAEKDNRITIYNQSNQGVSAARNLGLEKTNGKYITFVDSDDYVSFDMISEMLYKIQCERTIVFCDNKEIWEKNTEERKLFLTSSTLTLSREFVIREIARGHAGLVCGKLFEKRIVDENNIRFDNNVNVCEDQLFFLEVISHCKHFIHIPRSLYNYDRRNESSVTVRYHENAIENQLYVIKKIENILKENITNTHYIEEILDSRYWAAIHYCISNELNDIRKIDKSRNIELIISNENFIEVVERSSPVGMRSRLVKYGFKRRSTTFIRFVYFLIDKVLLPIRQIILLK